MIREPVMQDVTVTTPLLNMSLNSVESESAAKATNDTWTTEWRGDIKEVPEDGAHHTINVHMPTTPMLRKTFTSCFTVVIDNCEGRHL
jgi:hypothetical protein